MEKHNLEEYFSRRISSHTESIDKDKLWDDLGLEKKNRRSAGFYWWLGLGFLVLVIAAFGLNEVAYNSNGEGDFNRNQLNEDHKEYLVNEPVQHENLKIEHQVQIEDKGYQEVIQSKASYEQTASNKLKKHSGLENVKVEKFEKSKEHWNSDETDRNRTKRNVIIQKRNLKNENPVLVSRGDDFLKDNQKLNKNQNVEIELLKTGSHDDNYPSRGVDDKTSKMKSYDRLNKVLALPRLSDELLFTGSRNYSDIELPELADVKPWRSYMNGSQFSIGFYSDAALINRNLAKVEGSDTTSQLLNNRITSETVLERLGFGGYLRYETHSGFYGKLGINYTSINSNLVTSISKDSVGVSENEPLILGLLENGDTIASNYGELETEYLIERYYSVYTSHKLISIPVTLGYQLSLNNWSLFAEISPSVSISHIFEGLLYEDGYNLSAEPSYIDKSTKVSLGASFGVQYHLSNNLRILAQPYYQKTFNSFTTNRADHKEQYSFWGLRLGSELRF